MFNPESNIEASQIWNNLGTFYNLVDASSKTIIENYWEALVNGMEGVFYNLYQTELTKYLEYTLGYLEESYQTYQITLDGLGANTEYGYLSAPTGISASPQAPVISGNTYAYVVSSLNGVGETLGASPALAISGGSNLVTNPNTVSWSAVTGADFYNVYGRVIGSTFGLLATVSGLSYSDVGTTPGSKISRSSNTAKNTYWYALPENKIFLTIPTISGIGSGQTLVEGSDYEIDKLHKIKFLKPFHTQTFNIEQQTNLSWLLNSGKNKPLTLVRGLRYAFVVDDTTSTFTISGASGELVTGTTDGTIEFTPVTATPDTIYYTGGNSISIVNSLTNELVMDDNKTPTVWGDEFFSVSGLLLLPSLTSIYFPAFGLSTDPESLIVSGYYQPFTSGYYSGGLTYFEQRRDYAVHLKNWAFAYAAYLKKQPTVTNLTQAFELLSGLPFTYEACIVTNVTNSGGYNYVVTDERTYEITENLVLKVGIGDSLSKFDILCSGIALHDYIQSPTVVSGILTKEGQITEFDVRTTSTNGIGSIFNFKNVYSTGVLPENVTGVVG